MLDPEVHLADLALIQVRELDRLALDTGAQVAADHEHGDGGIDGVLGPAEAAPGEVGDDVGE